MADVPDEDLKLIQNDLLDLRALGALNRERSDEILAELKALKTKEPETYEKYADAMANGLPDITKGVIGAIKAAKSGDPFAISIAAVNIFSGTVTMAGPLLGPAGTVLAALGAMISTILGEFLEKPPSLQEELAAVLQKFKAEEKLNQLGVALDQIWVRTDTMKHHSTAYKPLDLWDGQQVTAIDSAWQWLVDQKNQSIPEWGEILEKTLMVWTEVLRYVSLSLSIPSTLSGVDKNGVLAALPAREERFLKYLRQIRPVVHMLGMFWHIDDGENGVMYAGNKIQFKDGVVRQGAVTQVEYYVKKFGATVSGRDLGLASPTYHVFSVLDGGYTFHTSIVTPDPNVMHTIMATQRDLSDIWAVSGGRPDLKPAEASAGEPKSAPKAAKKKPEPRKDEVCFYTAKGNYLAGYLREADGKETRFYDRDAKLPMTSVRAVHYPRTLPDDPEAQIQIGAGKDTDVLTDIDFIVYGGNDKGGMIFVDRYKGGEAPSSKHGLIQSPWPSRPLGGIGVDRQYLWVFYSGGFACATHASVISALNRLNRRNTVSPTWMKKETGVTDPKKLSVAYLSPCDDGTLVGSVTGTDALQDYSLHMAAYRTDLKKKTLEIEIFNKETRITGEGKRIEKVPYYCSQLYDQTLECLEERVGEGHAE